MGIFFLRRDRRVYGFKEPVDTAKDLHSMCFKHLQQRDKAQRDLYRIFFYDCPPLVKKAHNPVSGTPVDFSKTPVAMFREAFHKELRKLRKVALRLGYLDEKNARWVIRPEMTKKILQGTAIRKDVTDQDVYYDTRQKAVDMRIGLDIASVVFKRQVNQIILVAGDSDFVPAAKLARREGIDFILDPMWHPIRHDLHEHIDGLSSVCLRPSHNN